MSLIERKAGMASASNGTTEEEDAFEDAVAEANVNVNNNAPGPSTFPCPHCTTYVGTTAHGLAIHKGKSHKGLKLDAAIASQSNPLPGSQSRVRVDPSSSTAS